MEPYPGLVRRRMMELYAEKKTTKEIAGLFGVSRSGTRRVKQHLRERGTLEPLAGTPGPKGKLTDDVKARLGRLVASKPDATLAELREALAAEAKVSASTSTVDRWLGKLGLTFKKSR
jgi:transposase